jgi:hypothetical protein
MVRPKRKHFTRLKKRGPAIKAPSAYENQHLTIHPPPQMTYDHVNDTVAGPDPIGHVVRNGMPDACSNGPGRVMYVYKGSGFSDDELDKAWEASLTDEEYKKHFPTRRIPDNDNDNDSHYFYNSEWR